MPVATAASIDEWRDLSSAHFVDLECRSPEPSFRASIDTRPLGRLASVSRVRSRAILVDRTPSQARTDARDDVLVTLQLASAGAVSQFDRVAVLSPGAAAVYDTRFPYRLSMPSDGQDLAVVRLPRHALDLGDASIRLACARALAPSAPGMAAFGGYVTGLIADNGSIGRIGAELGTVLGQLLASVLRATIDTERPPRDDDHDAALLAALRAHAIANAHDPELDVPALARACFVSVRKAYAAFESVGDSPGTFLRTARLRAAAAMLRSPEADALSTAAVGERSGFRDTSTFTRAFRRHSGMTPAEWRRGGGAGALAVLPDRAP
ncbi:MAG: helix-turn-helix domain-containing protein [Pseudoclavibacter sp.]